MTAESPEAAESAAVFTLPAPRHGEYLPPLPEPEPFAPVPAATAAPKPDSPVGRASAALREDPRSGDPLRRWEVRTGSAIPDLRTFSDVELHALVAELLAEKHRRAARWLTDGERGAR